MGSSDSAGRPPAAGIRVAVPHPVGLVLAVAFIIAAALAAGFMVGQAWASRCPGGYTETWSSPFDMSCVELQNLPQGLS